MGLRTRAGDVAALTQNDGRTLAQYLELRHKLLEELVCRREREIPCKRLRGGVHARLGTDPANEHAASGDGHLGGGFVEASHDCQCA